MSKAARTFATVATLALPSIANADIVNGSFESEGYAGWTLADNAVNETFATAAIVEGEVRIEMGSTLLDHADDVSVSNYSSGLPFVPHPTDGRFQALLLQNGPATTWLSQIVNVPANGQLTFDVAYHNWDVAFSADQMLQLQILDTDSDAVLATVFRSAGALEMPMSHQAIDLGAFSGMTVRLQFELVAHNNFFDVQLDNIDLQTVARPDAGIDGINEQDELSANVEDFDGGCSTGRGGASLFAALALIALRRRRR
jgi:hypothetical protein